MIVGVKRSFPSRFLKRGVCKGGGDKKLNKNLFAKNLPKVSWPTLQLSLNVTLTGVRRFLLV
jgi:hypothetical protein